MTDRTPTWIAMGLCAAIPACTSPRPATHRDAPSATASSPSPASSVPPRTNSASHPALSIPARSGSPTVLVVFLHGLGADADSFQGIARALAPGLPKADLLTPDGFHPFDQAPTGRQWFSLSDGGDATRAARIREAGGEVSSWIDRELDARGLAHDRLMLVGFSQGAMVSAWLAVHRSPAPIAAVLFSGRVTDDEAPHGPPVGTRVFMAHGSEDSRIPASLLEPGARTLTAWGARVATHLYPGLGHQIDGAELRDAEAFLVEALAGE